MQEVSCKIEDYNLTKILHIKTCNNCGKKFYYDTKEFFMFQFNEIQSFEIQFRYGSKYDMQTWKFELCDDCLKRITESFLIKPNITEGEIIG